LLVGGDDEVARACARAVAPLPIVRAKRLEAAAERLRDFHPVAVYVGRDLSSEEANDIERVAAEQSTPLINLAVDEPEAALAHVRR
jgi:hypothetical protein